jgi:LmbE family N-acetylglucosaminyl deacetylase
VTCSRYQTVNLLLALCFLLPCDAIAQEKRTSTQPNAAEKNFVIMGLAAHPDDEDGATLAYYAKVKGYTVYSVFSNRGEGGQNEIGSALYDDLAEIRTRETFEAAALLGTQSFFMGFRDFGFSKTAKETFVKWGGKDSVVARLVYFIRKLRPDVMITNHDTITTKPNRQHGNHQAVGIAAYEAFFKAADSTYHPEQLTGGVTVWQPKKLFFRQIHSTAISGDSLVEINTAAKVDSVTVMQIATAALAKHRSQGMDKISPLQFPFFYTPRKFQLICADKRYPQSNSDLLDGIPMRNETASKISLDDITESSRFHAAEKKSLPSWESILPNVKMDNVKMGKSARDKASPIGLITSYDSTLVQTLSGLQIPFVRLDSAALTATNLKKFSTVLIDIRAYFYRRDLAAHTAKLMAYVKRGGHIVTFYHKPSDWNPVQPAPYPLTIVSANNERVTEEEAAVSYRIANHRLLTTPNKILPEDWNGWVQERSVYLPSDNPSETSPKYERLLAMHDENEENPPTALLHARYEKGSYTYCSLALYRQLQIRHTGAVKLLMNFLVQ